MHYHAEVWILERENAEAQIEEAMAPYYEEENNQHPLWDWYQVGGRWKGAHVSYYNPDEDPEHLIPCRYCNATGLREDMGHWEGDKKVFKDEWAKKCHGCYVCKGTGKVTIWPTQWNPHPKDTILVNEIPEDLTCYTLILPDEVLEDVEKIPIKKLLEDRKIRNGYLVTVDYHS